MITTDLKQLKESLGPRGFYENINSLLESKELSPEDFSLRQLWEACVGPTHQTLPSYAARQKSFITDVQQLSTLTEADLGTNLFQTVTGAVISRKVIESYNQVQGLIGDQLVSMEKSNVKNERVAGFTTLQEPREVKEGMPYEEASFGDKYVTTTESKKGRILSITEEAVHFDQTGELLRRASRLGEAARMERERTIVRGVMDADYSANLQGVYRPSGSLTFLFPSDGSLKNLIGPDSTNTDFAIDLPLVDWTTVGKVLRYHAVTQADDRHAPESGMPIPWNPRILLVPKALELTALRIVNATPPAVPVAATRPMRPTRCGVP